MFSQITKSFLEPGQIFRGTKEHTSENFLPAFHRYDTTVSSGRQKPSTFAVPYNRLRRERKREREDGVGTRITLLSYAQVKFSIVNYATIVSRIPESRLPYSLRVTDSAAQCSYRGRTGNERANKAHVAARGLIHFQFPTCCVNSRPDQASSTCQGFTGQG